jgi:hypothetical protein
MLSEHGKQELKKARATLRDSEALVIKTLKQLGLTYDEFKLLKNTFNQNVYLN